MDTSETATSTPSAILANAINDQQSPLLDLPPELRNIIYEFALQWAAAIRVPGISHQAATSLLSTCRQIRTEASPLYYKLNRFRTSIAAHGGSSVLVWLQILGQERCRLMRRLSLVWRCTDQILNDLGEQVRCKRMAQGDGFGDALQNVQKRITASVVSSLIGSGVRVKAIKLVNVVKPASGGTQPPARLA